LMGCSASGIKATYLDDKLMLFYVSWSVQLASLTVCVWAFDHPVMSLLWVAESSARACSLLSDTDRDHEIGEWGGRCWEKELALIGGGGTVDFWAPTQQGVFMWWALLACFY
jgi:hypothetical protein